MGIGKGSAEKLVSFLYGKIHAEYVEICERKIGGSGVMMKEFVGMGEKVLFIRLK